MRMDLSAPKAHGAPCTLRGHVGTPFLGFFICSLVSGVSSAQCAKPGPSAAGTRLVVPRGRACRGGGARESLTSRDRQANLTYLFVEAPQISVLPHAVEDLRCGLDHFRGVSGKEKTGHGDGERPGPPLDIARLPGAPPPGLGGAGQHASERERRGHITTGQRG